MKINITGPSIATPGASPAPATGGGAPQAPKRPRPSGPPGLSSRGEAPQAADTPPPRAALPNKGKGDETVGLAKDMAVTGTNIGKESSNAMFSSIEDAARLQMLFAMKQGVLQSTVKMAESAAKQIKSIGDGIKNVGA